MDRGRNRPRSEEKRLARQRTTTPTKPEDARAHRSIEALQSALLELVEHKAFDQIAIKDITETAGVSYPTFFRRFGSKEELLDHIAAEEVRRFMSIGAEALSRGQESSAQDLCEYVHDHRKLWTVLLNGGAASVMREEFNRVSREFSQTRPPSNPWIPSDLAVPFVTSGVFEIVSWWLRQPPDYPIRNVVKLFDALIIDVAVRSRNITLD
jgi:AcrR family transcriptional regulator